MMRLHEHAPLVTRSDGKSYHLLLFDGPSVWYSKNGSPIAGRAVAGFYYASDRLKTDHAQVTVILRTVDLRKPEVVRALEESANLLAVILESGQQPEQSYLFESGHISKLPEDERP
jgi:hypothetical protein